MTFWQFKQAKGWVDDSQMSRFLSETVKLTHLTDNIPDTILTDNTT